MEGAIDGTIVGLQDGSIDRVGWRVGVCVGTVYVGRIVVGAADGAEDGEAVGTRHSDEPEGEPCPAGHG